MERKVTSEGSLFLGFRLPVPFHNVGNGIFANVDDFQAFLQKLKVSPVDQDTGLGIDRIGRYLNLVWTD